MWSLISIYVEDTPLGVSLRAFPEKFHWKGKSYPDMDGTIPRTGVPDWILEGEEEEVSLHLSFSASWLQTQYDQLLHAPTVIPSPPWEPMASSHWEPKLSLLCQGCFGHVFCHSNKKGNSYRRKLHSGLHFRACPWGLPIANLHNLTTWVWAGPFCSRWQDSVVTLTDSMSQ